MKTNQFYCVACRKAVTVSAKDVCVTRIKNRRSGPRPALRAKCKCGTMLTKFIKKDSESKMKSKYRSCRSKSRKRRSRSKSRKRRSRSRSRRM